MVDFRYRRIEVLGKDAFRLGLASNFGIDEAGVEEALDGPTNYLFWTPRMKQTTQPLRRALARDRDAYIVATGPTTAWWGGNLRKFTENTLRTLNTDYLDILQMHWLGVTSSWKPGIVEEMVKLREEGKVRALGVSIHDRKRAGELAIDSPLDSLMIRYNAAHPGAERDIFPHLAARNPVVIAYTATRWRKLLKRPKGWTGEVPTAGHCYRFCLSNPNVSLVLHGPKTSAQLRENLAALDDGALSQDEQTWMREFGAVVHG
ncbi:MAG: aryl-alcohol dehydrogenase-like predicted oxidoreductase [Myxococcota bacterium]|jgi:aryl-alcohol dehydrogenase-like predicted oxidoreductase